MTFDLISGLHMQIQTWHPPLWLCTHAKYYVKSIQKCQQNQKYASFLDSDSDCQLYSKTCVKRPFSKRTKIGFQDQLSLNAGQKHCRIQQYFRPSLSYHLSLRTLFLSIFESQFYTGFTVRLLHPYFAISWQQAATVGRMHILVASFSYFNLGRQFRPQI